MTLSVVVPCFNEEKKLPALFSALERCLADSTSVVSEVILVNDGSTDNTEALLTRFLNQHSAEVKIISYQKNKGKGYAIRQGMLTISSEWGLFLDTDLSVGLEEIKKLVPYMNLQSQVLIGSRAASDSIIVVPQSSLRQFFGKCFTALAGTATGVHLPDFTCGFKCFSRVAAKRIFSAAKINRWAYDAEVVYLARIFSYQIKSVGVRWKNSEESKVRILPDSIRSIIDLIRIRFIHHNTV